MRYENPRPARLVSPGAVLRRELDARGWSQEDLARITGRPEQAISEIVQGARRITLETAVDLGKAFGTSPDLWLGLEP
jgi:addiction module HigA family antidote